MKAFTSYLKDFYTKWAPNTVWRRVRLLVKILQLLDGGGETGVLQQPVNTILLQPKLIACFTSVSDIPEFLQSIHTRAIGAAITQEFLRYVLQSSITTEQKVEVERVERVFHLLTTRFYTACNRSTRQKNEKKKVDFMSTQISSAATAKRIQASIARNIPLKRAICAFLVQCQTIVERYSFLKSHCERIKVVLGYEPPVWARRFAQQSSADGKHTASVSPLCLSDLVNFMDLVFAIIQTDTKVNCTLCVNLFVNAHFTPEYLGRESFCGAEYDPALAMQNHPE